MKRIENKGKLATLLLGVLLALSSCGPKVEAEDPRAGGGGARGKIYDIIVKKIDTLNVETNWNRSQARYAEILKLIPDLKKSASQRNNLKDASKIAYSHSMDTILYLALSGDCAKRHDEMKTILNMRNDASQFASVPYTAIHQRVVAQYNEHQEMLDYVNKVNTKSYYKSLQKIKSFEDKYNESLENAEINRAKGFQNKQPTCSEIINGLKKVVDRTVFKTWRQCYCEQLVSLYSKTDNRTEGDYNVLSGYLNKYYIKQYPKDTYTKKLKDTLEEFRKEFEEEGEID